MLGDHVCKWYFLESFLIECELSKKLRLLQAIPTSSVAFGKQVWEWCLFFRRNDKKKTQVCSVLVVRFKPFQAIASRSDEAGILATQKFLLHWNHSSSTEVTTGWREFGGPFYRALALYFGCILRVVL